jgi:N4-gp56 family major capsid protein
MAIKSFTTPPGDPLGSNVASNVDLVAPRISSYADLLQGDADSDLRSRLWSELVTRDAREKNVFAKFIGGEGSGKPITEKRDLSAGGSDKVTFTTVAPIRGQGVRGEAVLKNSTDNLDFGTFSVEIDLVRHAVSWTQVLKLMKFTGKTIDQLSADVMSEWMARTEQDQLQFALRQICITQGNQNFISGYGTGTGGSLEYVDGLSTDIIQEAKQALIANGGEPINTGGDINQDIPGYLFFAPDACLRPLRSDPDYLEAILQADARSDSNKLYTGSYAKWDNNVIANHNVLIDTARGRQGSPLLPTYYSFAANGNVTVTAANATAAVGNTPATGPIGGTDGDYVANFRGAFINIPGGGGVAMGANDNGTYYILGIDTDGTVALYSYLQSAVDQTNFGTIELTRVVRANDGLTTTNVKADNDQAFSAGALFVQANDIGCPIGYALAMGKDALYFAKGKIYGEQIFHYDDFANSGNEAHLSAVGVQSVYGVAARHDTRNRVPAVQLVEVVRQVPGLSIAHS